MGLALRGFVRCSRNRGPFHAAATERAVFRARAGHAAETCEMRGENRGTPRESSKFGGCTRCPRRPGAIGNILVLVIFLKKTDHLRASPRRIVPSCITHKCVSHSAPLRGASLCSQSITPLGRPHPGLRRGRSVKSHPACRVLDSGLDCALTAPLLRLDCAFTPPWSRSPPRRTRRWPGEGCVVRLG